MTKRKISRKRFIYDDTRGTTLSKRMESYLFLPVSIFGFICSFLDPTFMQWFILTQVDKCCHQYTKKLEVTKNFLPDNVFATNKIPDHFLIYFSNLLHLKRRYLTDTRVLYLSTMQNLNHLELTWSMQLSDSGAQIISQLTSLKHLVFAGIDKITNNGISHIWSLKNLQFLMFGGGCMITNDGFKGIANLTALKRLDIVGFPLITNKCLNNFMQLPSISELRIQLCDNIYDLVLNDRKQMEKYEMLYHFDDYNVQSCIK